LLPRAEFERFAGLAPGYEKVQAICDWVQERTRFRPGATNSATCALNTLRDRVGVCRDFAHLMIACCRAAGVPARIATGIDYGADSSPGPHDFHAYVEAFLGDRWYIFDPAGMSPANGLLRIATGRDAGDVAFATIFGKVCGGAPFIRIDAVEQASPMPDGNAVSTARGRPHFPFSDGLPLPLAGVCPTGNDPVRQANQRISDHANAMHL
jgi:transglutaminase-like putative cysteine protease